jgi:hypothetical protein
LRGLLLYAWGWSVVGMIAFYSGIAALLGAIAVLIGLVLGFVMHERQLKRDASGRAGAASTSDAKRTSAPAGV